MSECTTCGATHVDGVDCFGEPIEPRCSACLIGLGSWAGGHTRVFPCDYAGQPNPPMAPRSLVEWCEVCQIRHHVNPEPCS